MLFYSSKYLFLLGAKLESDIRINSGMVILRSIKKGVSLFFYSLIRSEDMKLNITNFMSGSAQPQLPIKDIKKMPTIIPNEKLILLFNNISSKAQVNIDQLNNQNYRLNEFKDLLLSKMTKI